jgi:DinB family protein
MPASIQMRFEREINQAETRLRSVSEEASRIAIRPGGWTRKQVLGHLIDSALNNHQRFVRAAVQDEYRGPTYDQEAWVRMHGYDGIPWRVLVDFWLSHNQLLTRAVALVPAAKYDVACYIGDNPAMSLLDLMEDYLRHMLHHLDQIYRS